MLPAILLAAATHVAVLEFHNEVGQQVDRIALSQRVREIARGTPGLSVMTREQMFQVATANPDALNKCDDQGCVELGKLLGADQVIDGRIAKIGATLRLTLKLVEVGRGRVLATSVAAGKTQEELLGGVEKAVKKLLKKPDA